MKVSPALFFPLLSESIRITLSSVLAGTCIGFGTSATFGASFLGAGAGATARGWAAAGAAGLSAAGGEAGWIVLAVASSVVSLEHPARLKLSTARKTMHDKVFIDSSC